MMHRGVMVAGLAGLLLTACGQNRASSAPGTEERTGQYRPGRGRRGHGRGDRAAGAFDTEAFVKDAAIGGLWMRSSPASSP